MRREDGFALAGRLLMAALFLASAFSRIVDYGASVQVLEAGGVPAAPFMNALAAGLEALGGLALALGYHARWAAAALGGAVVAATAVFPGSLLKNLAIVGGLLQVASFGPGAFALDARRALR